MKPIYFLIFIGHLCLQISAICGVVYKSDSADNELPFCASDPKSMPKHSRSIMIVSTLDGRVTALDGSEGSVLWSLETEPGPLLSSTISNYKFPSNGKIVQLIPALDGDLYTYDGEQMGTTPISADNLLSSSMSMHDDTVITGGKEIRTYGINKRTGQLQYSCGTEACQYFNSAIVDEDVVVLRQTTRTVRAVSSLTGAERWNYSVGQHEVGLASPYPNAGCHGNKKDFFSHSQENSGYGQIQAVDSTYLETEIQFKAAEGHIVVLNTFGDRLHKWEHRFDAPIVHAWKVVNQDLQTLDIFKNNQEYDLDQDVETLTDKHMVYIGSYNKQLFILQSQSLLKSIALEWKTFGKDLHSAPPEVAWQPYLSTAPSRTPIIQGGMPPDTAVLINVHGDHGSTAVAVAHNSGEYPFDSGLYLLVAHPLNSSALDDNSEDESTFDQIIIVSLWYWWKEVLAISATFAIAINLCITRHYIRIIRGKFLKENTKEIVCIEPLSLASDPPQTSKALESQTSSDSSLLGTSSSEFVSRYFTDFESIQTLGKGGFGVVFQARNKFDDCDYAIKRIRMPNREESKKRIMREVKALAKLDHSGIVRYYNSWLECPPWEWQQQMDPTMDSMSALTPLSVTSMDDLHGSFSAVQPRTAPRFQISTNETVCSTRDTVGRSSPKRKNSAKNKAGKNFRIDESHLTSLDPSAGHLCSKSFSSRDSAVLSPGEDSDSLALLESEAKTFASTGDLPSRFSDNSSSVSFICFEANAGSNPQGPVSMNGPTILTASSTDAETRVHPEAERLALTFRSSWDKPPKSYLYIQMQLCHKDSLKDWLCSRTETRDRFEVLGYFHEIVSAVEYVHEQGLMHRDLKPSNILFALDGSIKIGDFGLVTDLSHSEEGSIVEERLNGNTDVNQRHTNQVGTLMYMSPEQLTDEIYDHKVDIFSSGLILFELLVPFHTAMERIKVMTDARELRFPERFSKDYSQECTLVRQMLSHDAKDRPCASTIKRHSLLQDFEPRPEYLRHRRSRSMSRTYSTSSSSTASCGSSAEAAN